MLYSGSVTAHPTELVPISNPIKYPLLVSVTLLVAVLTFLLSLSAGLLSILASVLGLLSVLMLFVEKDISTGIAGLLMAFAISPFGLPALAGWLLAKLDELNGSLRGFIMG